MINIEHIENLEEEYYITMDQQFNKLAIENGVECNYIAFTFVAKEEGKILGFITGHSYYKEVHIGDLIVFEEYRNKHIGTKLMQAVEDYFKDKGVEHMNLSTYSFQAPGFYKKCGFEIEFIRESKVNPKLNKYYLVKYF